MFTWAMKCELVDIDKRNPINLVRVWRLLQTFAAAQESDDPRKYLENQLRVDIPTGLSHQVFALLGLPSKIAA
jgi:hypothetical protein